MATFAIAAATRKAQATANGSTTQFAFSFSVNTEADVAVFVGTTLKTISTHYTVSITSSTGAGSITFTSGNTPSNGQIVTLMSKTALARSSVYTSGGTINATSLETDFDTNMMLFQQQDERLDRVITAPVDDATSINMTLPNKDARKGKFLGFDATTGNPISLAGTLTSANVTGVTNVATGQNATVTASYSSVTGVINFAFGLPQGATGNSGDNGIFSAIASQAEAESGTDNAKGMSPVRVKQAIVENAGNVSNAAFYGFKITGSELQVDQTTSGGSEAFVQSNYDQTILNAIGLTFTINAAGHLLLTTP